MWLMCIHSWGNWVCFLSFDSIAIVVLKLWNDRRTLSKMVFKTECLENLLWIVWYDYVVICEWLIGIEYDAYHNVLYFLLYLNDEIIWCCWVIMVMLLVIIYVYVHISCWWLYKFMCIYVVGDYICVCAYMLLVNFLTCYWCWILGVSMYWNMLVWFLLK